MLKTITGMVPFAIGLAAIGIAIWWLLGREMALGRWLLGAFLVAHGLVHLLFVVPQPATSAEGSGAAPWPFDMARSWLVTGAGLDVNLVRALGLALICAVTVGFLLAGLATVGILVPGRLVAGPGRGFGCGVCRAAGALLQPQPRPGPGD